MWNFRMLLDVDGLLKTAKQKCEICAVDDMKIYQVVNEVKMYGAVVTALQETKGLEMMFTMLEGA